MRVLMTGGGTAGHVNPAIAIANTIKKYEPNSEIAFVCSAQKNDKAADLVPREGYKDPFRVDICGSYSIWNPKNIKTLYYMFKSAGQAKKIVDEFSPDIIIGTGGFACYPVLHAGVKKGIPTVVHESNAIAGRAVKKLSGEVDCVMVNFKDTIYDLKNPDKAIRVGNPIIYKDNPGKTHVDVNQGFKRSVLSFGGSLGAEYLNIAVADMMSDIADKFPDVLFCHASGKRDYENMLGYFSKLGLDKKRNVMLKDYIYDMSERMEKADIVISRAGAMTLSELALYGKAAVLVPSPYVAANHQYKNASALSNANAAKLVEEKELESGKLRVVTENLLCNRRECESLRSEIKKFATPDSNRIIYEKIKDLVKK